MKIVVFSDTHGLTSSAQDVVEKNLDADLFIFLGDGENDYNFVYNNYPQKSFLGVAGNCDYYSKLPDVGEFFLKGKKIVYTHGHRYNVRASIDVLYCLAKEREADIVLFGHTHERFYSVRDGIHFLNPGSATIPRDGKGRSYAVIELTEKTIDIKHFDLK